MSLVPYSRYSWDDDFFRSQRAMERKIFDDFLPPWDLDVFRNKWWWNTRIEDQIKHVNNFMNSPLIGTHELGSTTIRYDNDQFQATIDVQHFRPEEIEVRVDDNVITVEGKHEESREKQDEYRREHNAAYKHFLKRYVLPFDYDNNRVESRMSTDGFLTITAPKKGVWVPWRVSTDRRIPITYTPRTYTSRPWLRKLSWK
nr:unnamed protein product [Callosobruchus chinensis]